MIMLLRFKNRTATVLTFTPPAMDWEDPPIHIKRQPRKIVEGWKSAGLTEAKPVVLGRIALNNDWTIFVKKLMSLSVPSYSKIRKRTVPAATRMEELIKTSFVFKSKRMKFVCSPVEGKSCFFIGSVQSKY